MLQHDPAERPSAESVLDNVLFGGEGGTGAAAAAEGSGECMLCFGALGSEVLRCVIYHPEQACGGCCLKCAQGLMERGDTCPRCQRPVTKIQRLFD